MSINWGKLVAQGRAKAPGISWSKEELNARYKLMIPAEYVRDGVLTLKDYKEALGSSPKEVKTKEELFLEAKKVGINVTPDAPKEVLQQEIEKKKVKKVVKKVVKKKVVKKKGK